MRRLLLFSLVGIVAQLIDGALGMAFGVTASTLLISSGTGVAVASASVHLAEVGTTFVSGVSHWRLGNVHWPTVRWVAVPGAVSAFVGASLLSNIDGDAAKPWISSLLLVLGAYVLIRFRFGMQRQALTQEHTRPRFLVPLGSVGGFVDAIGGGGWGPITTPALLTVGRMEPRRAVGSTSASEFLVSVAASIGFLTNLGGQGVDARIVAGLMAGGAVVAPLAAWLVKHLAPQVLGSLVGTLIIVTNSRTLLQAWEVPGPTRFAVLLGLVAAGGLLLRGAARRSGTPTAVLEAAPA